MKQKNGFSLIELLVASSLLMILVGMVIPVSMTAHSQADSAACYSHLRQINTVLHAYLVREKDRLPHEDNGDTRHPKNCGWFVVLPEIVGDIDIWHCPSEPELWRSYKMNSLLEDEAHPFALFGSLYPGNLVLFFDGRVDNKGVRLAPKGTWAMAEDRHPDGTHLLLLNGAVVNYDSESDAPGWSDPGPFPWKPKQR